MEDELFESFEGLFPSFQQAYGLNFPEIGRRRKSKNILVTIAIAATRHSSSLRGRESEYIIRGNPESAGGGVASSLILF